MADYGMAPLAGPPLAGPPLRGHMDGNALSMSATNAGEDPFSMMSPVPPLILRCKIVLLGDSTVGKTSIAQVFQGGVQNFPKNYSMTVGIDFMVKKVSIPDTNILVEMYIVDCGGFSVDKELLRPHWENAN